MFLCAPGCCYEHAISIDFIERIVSKLPSWKWRGKRLETDPWLMQEENNAESGVKNSSPTWMKLPEKGRNSS